MLRLSVDHSSGPPSASDEVHMASLNVDLNRRWRFAILDLVANPRQRSADPHDTPMHAHRKRRLTKFGVVSTAPLPSATATMATTPTSAVLSLAQQVRDVARNVLTWWRCNVVEPLMNPDIVEPSTVLVTLAFSGTLTAGFVFDVTAVVAVLIQMFVSGFTAQRALFLCAPLAWAATHCGAYYLVRRRRHLDEPLFVAYTLIFFAVLLVVLVPTWKAPFLVLWVTLTIAVSAFVTSRSSNLHGMVVVSSYLASLLSALISAGIAPFQYPTSDPWPPHLTGYGDGSIATLLLLTVVSVAALILQATMLMAWFREIRTAVDTLSDLVSRTSSALDVGATSPLLHWLEMLDFDDLQRRPFGDETVSCVRHAIEALQLMRAFLPEYARTSMDQLRSTVRSSPPLPSAPQPSASLAGVAPGDAAGPTTGNHDGTLMLPTSVHSELNQRPRDSGLRNQSLVVALPEERRVPLVQLLDGNGETPSSSHQRQQRHPPGFLVEASTSSPPEGFLEDGTASSRVTVMLMEYDESVILHHASVLAGVVRAIRIAGGNVEHFGYRQLLVTFPGDSDGDIAPAVRLAATITSELQHLVLLALHHGSAWAGVCRAGQRRWRFVGGEAVEVVEKLLSAARFFRSRCIATESVASVAPKLCCPVDLCTLTHHETAECVFDVREHYDSEDDEEIRKGSTGSSPKSSTRSPPSDHVVIHEDRRAGSIGAVEVLPLGTGDGAAAATTSTALRHDRAISRTAAARSSVRAAMQMLCQGRMKSALGLLRHIPLKDCDSGPRLFSLVRELERHIFRVAALPPADRNDALYYQIPLGWGVLSATPLQCLWDREEDGGDRDPSLLFGSEDLDDSLGAAVDGAVRPTNFASSLTAESRSNYARVSELLTQRRQQQFTTVGGATDAADVLGGDASSEGTGRGGFDVDGVGAGGPDATVGGADEPNADSICGEALFEMYFVAPGGEEISSFITDNHGRQWKRGQRTYGRGSFGSVFAASNQYGRQVAVKCINLDSNAISATADEVSREIHTFSSLQNDHIVSYVGDCLQGSYYYIFMESLPAGSLHNLLERFHRLPENAVRRYVRHAVLGLRYLHANGVVHCDIKPANILVTRRGQCKLSDFGSALNRTLVKVVDTPWSTASEAHVSPPLAHATAPSSSPQLPSRASLPPVPESGSPSLHGQPHPHDDSTDDGFSFSRADCTESVGKNSSKDQRQEPEDDYNELVVAGTPQYMSPEACRGSQIDYHTDIWSLGITTFELLTGRLPWRNSFLKMRNERFIQMLGRHEDPASELELDELDSISLSGKEFVARCLNPNPEARPTPTELLRDKFLRV